MNKHNQSENVANKMQIINGYFLREFVSKLNICKSSQWFLNCDSSFSVNFVLVRRLYIHVDLKFRQCVVGYFLQLHVKIK